MGSPCRQLGPEGVSTYIKERQPCLWGVWLCGAWEKGVLLLRYVGVTMLLGAVGKWLWQKSHGG